MRHRHEGQKVAGTEAIIYSSVVYSGRTFGDLAVCLKPCRPLRLQALDVVSELVNNIAITDFCSLVLNHCFLVSVDVELIDDAIGLIH